MSPFLALNHGYEFTVPSQHIFQNGEKMDNVHLAHPTALPPWQTTRDYTETRMHNIISNHHLPKQ
jgi:hypothetical protein